MSLGVHRSLVSTTAALTTRVTLAGLVTVTVLAALPAQANPLGGSVPTGGGTATIQGQGTSSVIVNQSSQSAIINWNTFNIGKGETTTFNQPNSTSTVLNRVIGGQGPSFLDGTLTANGRVFIVNGDGILFGPQFDASTPPASSPPPATSATKTSWRAATTSTFRAAERLDRQSGNHHRRTTRRLCGFGGAGRAQLRHHHGDARHRQPRVRQRLHARFLRRPADHARGQRPDRGRGQGRADRQDAQVAGRATPARSAPTAAGSS